METDNRSVFASRGVLPKSEKWRTTLVSGSIFIVKSRNYCKFEPCCGSQSRAPEFRQHARKATTRQVKHRSVFARYDATGWQTECSIVTRKKINQAFMKNLPVLIVMRFLKETTMTLKWIAEHLMNRNNAFNRLDAPPKRRR